MKPTVKLVSLNIEEDKHYSTVIPFLKNEQPDIICLQEVFENDIHLLTKPLAMNCTFAPGSIMNDQEHSDEGRTVGIAILTKTNPVRIFKDYYVGKEDRIPLFVREEPFIQNRVLLTVQIEKESVTYTVCTTHFTWSPNGQATSLQRKDMKSMLSILENHKDIILCGDFNAPRGGEIWEKIAEEYTDNIPPQITSTLDGSFHRAGNLQYVVDGIFTTRNYDVKNMKIFEGISDHKALVAEIGNA